MKKTRYKMEVYYPEVIEIIEIELDDEELAQYREIVDQARKEFLEEYPEDVNNEEGWRQWLTDTIINECLTIPLWNGFINIDAQVRWIDLDHPIVEEE